MRSTLAVIAAAACSLAIQDRSDGRQITRLNLVRAEELVLHEDGRDFLRIGRIGEGEGAPHGILLTDPTGRRRASVLVGQAGLDVRYEEEDAEGEVHTRVSLSSSADGSRVQSFWMRDAGELSFGGPLRKPALKAFWKQDGRMVDPLRPVEEGR